MYRSKKITLRPFEKNDLERYREWINDNETASLIDRVLPVSEIEHEKWYSSLQENKNMVVFAIEINQEAKYIGNVWLWNIDVRHRKAEVRIIIGEKEAQGKGFGVEALELISWFAFEKLNLHKLYAYVLASNEMAKKAFEKALFLPEGILKEDKFCNGKYEDVFLLARIRPK